MDQDHIARIIDLTLRLVGAVRRDVEVNGDRTTKAVKDAARKLADEQLAGDVFTHERYVGIVKTSDAYMAWAGPKGRKRAVAEAAKFWKVGGRTVENALAFRADAPFMDWPAFQKWRARPAATATK